MRWTLSFAAWMQSSGDCDGGWSWDERGVRDGPTVVERGKK